MRAGAKRYNTSYKKKIDVHHDTFLPRRSPKEIVQCSGCGAFYHRRHWSLTVPPGFSHPVHPHPTFCPACKKIKERSVSGVLHLLGMGEADRGEVLRIVRNEEGRAYEKNPLDRIMRLEKVQAKSGDEWKVETTTEKLAQRLGRSVRHARGGKLEFKWSHNNKFVRVVWNKSAPPVGS
jgi:hypothetical protein